MVRDSNHAHVFRLDTVYQGVREILQREYPRFVRSGHANVGEAGKQGQSVFKFVGEIVSGGECVFFEVPVNRRIGVALCLIAQANPHRLLRH